MKCDNYKELFTKDYLMGPNSMRLIDEMLDKHPIDSNLRILDLGCGKGLTSLFLAKEAEAYVYATDLWCSATDNYKDFKKWNVDSRVVPIHADANDLPFADEYFDVLVSIDSFHYFATQEGFFEEKILPLVKKDGLIFIAIPGLKEEIHGQEPALMLEWVNGEESEYELFHSLEWWKAHIGESDGYEIISAYEMENFERAWEDWFTSGHEFAVRDNEFFERGVNEYLNIVALVIRKK